MADSTVSLEGNLTADPTLRTTQQGEVVVGFTVAVREGNKDNPATGFYDVSAWGTLGQNVADSLAKGDRVVVAGVLKTNTWQDKEGNNRSKMQVTANAVGPDLRWATASITKNGRPAVAPVQQHTMTDQEWAAQTAKDGLPTFQPAISDEPF